jgi:hypothetical protein
MIAAENWQVGPFPREVAVSGCTIGSSEREVANRNCQARAAKQATSCKETGLPFT